MLVFPEGTKAGDELAAGMSEAFKAALLSGVGRLLHDIAPAFLMCDPRDLGRVVRVRDPHFGCGAIYLFDRYPGGTGLAEGLAQLLSSTVPAARERLVSCSCGGGCPSCIGVDFADSGGVGQGPSSALEGAEVKARVLKLLGVLGGGG